MRLIDKKNFFPTVCVIFTCLAVGKIVLEALVQKVYGNYQENLLVMLLLAFLGTLVLSQHYRLARFPLVAVIVLQYVVLIAAVMLLTWCLGLFETLHADAYHDMFWSFTVPYAIAAAWYYLALYCETRKADRMLQEIRMRRREDEEHHEEE